MNDPEEAPVDDGAALEPSGGGRIETVVAIAIAVGFLLVPLIYFQHRYELFIAESGGIKEGAAGASLALAVIFRTVSRTVLRTIVRTSARAGMKASMKGALQAGMRVLFASMMKTSFGKGQAQIPPSELRRANLRSLGFASVLLYASWIIVIGLGQPFASLKTEAEADVAAVEEAAQRRVTLEKRRGPAIESFKMQAEVTSIGDQIRSKMKELKMERDLDRQRALEAELIFLAHDEDDAKDALAASMKRSNNVVFDPKSLDTEPPPTPADEVIGRFFARAPWPGHTPWGSMVLWVGGLVMVLPLWFIYFAQAGVSRKLGVTLRHDTGIDGGVIQLYFAGAFSFMPLTSDVIIDGDDAQKGKVALAGLLAPSFVAMGLWAAWKITGIAPLLFAADAFLIYPMVQTFPLNPLDGMRVWRWNKLVWLLVFLFVMTGFMLAGSEGLKNVI